MRPSAIVAGMFVASLLFGQSAGQRPTSVAALHFLEGTWEAKTAPGAGGPAVSGTYTFRTELGGHILSRHSSSDSCEASHDFDCDHHDLLYIYQDVSGQPLKAIYFDNEGHVIHYDVFLSGATDVVFASGTSVPGPKFRLVYALRDGVLSGKFQAEMPGQSEWKSYLEWSGAKR